MPNIKLLIAIVAALFVGVTSFMPPEVYGSWWWFLFWGICALVLLVGIWKVRSLSMKLLHVSLLLMIIGGMTTALTAVRGSVHLTPGIPVDSFIDNDGEFHKLPFSLTLSEFQTDYYPGMNFPRDFRSKLLIDARPVEVSMNHIGREGHWRIFQQSFDGKGGSILSLAYDPWGYRICYFGFALFALSGLSLFFRRRGLVIIALVTSVSAFAETPDERQVEFHGRIVPFATVASELTFKLTGQQKVAGMGSTEFVISLMEHPQQWSDVAFIKTGGGYVSVASLYDDDGKYLPQINYRGGKGKEDAELLKLDEKVALLAELWRGELFAPAPKDLMRPAVEIGAEVAYVKSQPVKWFFMLALVAGILCLIFRRAVQPGAAVLFGLSIVVFCWKWWICGYFPVAGTGEIMFFTAVVLSGSALVLSRRHSFASGLALLMSGFAALLSWLAVKNPVMTPLMPVLASPWLAVHVSLVMISYALLCLVSMLAIVRNLPLAMRLLPVGLYFLGLGIIVGAMWANVSWGRYWAWDPKETWALVTLLLYAVPLHRSLGLRKHSLLLRVYLAFAFLAIVMTYAGVNYLPSLHAYV